MDKKSVLNIVDRLKNLLEQKEIKVAKIILYGSYAKGNYTENSDIDLIVLSEDFASMNYWERIDCLSGPIYEIFEPIEALSFTPAEWANSHSFLTDYAASGEIVYAA
jgi:uncharacterized protein